MERLRAPFAAIFLRRLAVACGSTVMRPRPWTVMRRRRFSSLRARCSQDTGLVVVGGVDDADVLVDVFDHVVEFLDFAVEFVQALPFWVRQALDCAV